MYNVHQESSSAAVSAATTEDLSETDWRIASLAALSPLQIPILNSVLSLLFVCDTHNFVMAIISRSGASSGEAQASPRVTISTAMGIVLGALSLFTLVVGYQLLSCMHKKPPPAQRRNLVLVPPARRRPSLLRTIRNVFNRFHTFIGNLKPKFRPVHDTQTGSLQKRKALRFLHLPTQRQRNRRQTREKFATRLRLNIPKPSPFETSSPHQLTNQWHYIHLEDGRHSEAVCRTEKPPEAVMSPWSPREQDYPYPTSPTAWQWSQWNGGGDSDTPLPSSPPPAYVPGTPLRCGFTAIHRDSALQNIDNGPSLGDRDVTKEKEMVDLSEIVSLEPRPRASLTHEASESVFVISDDLDSDWDSSSIYSNFSDIL
ncbi:hypothetical protein AcV7_005040 [Taiwanofungus camphoratus]|nr:hypothetical protein AcV7_005040 [Antrodia cinnamomea]